MVEDTYVNAVITLHNNLKTIINTTDFGMLDYIYTAYHIYQEDNTHGTLTNLIDEIQLFLKHIEPIYMHANALIRIAAYAKSYVEPTNRTKLHVPATIEILIDDINMLFLRNIIVQQKLLKNTPLHDSDIANLHSIINIVQICINDTIEMYKEYSIPELI